MWTGVIFEPGADLPVRNMPELIEAGYVYIAQPPLYKITHNRRKDYYVNNDGSCRRL